MNELAIRLRDDEQGMSTAEYAVGTVAVCGLGGVLIKLLSSDKFADLLWTVISKAFSFLF
jgi:Flp pilus assembly pilin Flp